MFDFMRELLTIDASREAANFGNVKLLLDRICEHNLYPRILTIEEGVNEPECVADGSKLLQFGANNYLSLSNCPEVKAAAIRAIEEFGRLDILVNNAGAIWLRPILKTPAKRFDLVMGVNVRAAFLACYYALPHMVKQKWGHVLNMCPRLSTSPSPGKVAYMISKLGMAYVALGLAAEHAAENIAGNTLWPRTIIESQASINWNMADRTQWRTPEIVCDAAIAIFAQEPHTSTGRQWIDEEALAELAGVTNFDNYWCAGKPPAHPIYIDKW